MKHKRVLAATMLLALAGFILWRATTFPRLRTKQESYPISTESVVFILEAGTRPLRFGSAQKGQLECYTARGWEKVSVNPDWEAVFYTAIGYDIAPFSASRVTILLEKWNISEAGPGTYRFVLPCRESSLFGGRRGEEFFLTSNSFELQ